MEDISWMRALLFVLAVAGLVWFGRNLMVQWLQQRWLHSREAVEDTLMHLHQRQHEGRLASIESLSGAIGVPASQALRLVQRMETQGLLSTTSDGLRLTREGLRLTVQVVRAHRLFERYLADETAVPMQEIHLRAHKMQHVLSPEDVDRLDAYMGHPTWDPHGDSIPTAAGDISQMKAHSLIEWPPEKPAQIVHIEDEPLATYAQIVAEGLAPGMIVTVIESTPTRILLESGEEEHVLAPVVAANIAVQDAPQQPSTPPGQRLSALKVGESRRVLTLDNACQGLTRRRFLDLGITPGTTIEPVMQSALGEPRAYRVRGSLIALRREQADMIWVEADGSPFVEAKRSASDARLD